MGRMNTISALLFFPTMICLVVSCSQPETEEPPRLEPLFSRGAEPVDVGEVPAGLKNISSVECSRCHEEIGREWADDMHRHAYTNKYFEAGFGMDRHDFCRHCHAPRAPSGQEPTGPAREDGIDCATCHVRDGYVLAGRVTEKGLEAHAMRVEPSLSRSEYCAGCHQFNFPDVPIAPRVIFDPTEFLQLTYDEWASSRAASRGVQCQGCHMPIVGEGEDRHRSHRFRGLRDEDFLKRSVSVDISASKRTKHIVVRAKLAARGVGHSVPTGDTLRQLELRVFPEGASERGKVVTLGRRFAPRSVTGRDDTVVLRKQVADDRVPPPGSDESSSRLFLFSDVAAERFRYELTLLRCSEELARRQRLTLDETRIPLLSGVVSVAGTVSSSH